MATPLLQLAWAGGEVSPSLYGRIDLEKERMSASTCRNMYVNYRGGASSRAGSKFVGFSKQTGREVAPRLIDFQFSINQGLVLEFGQQYMRVISEGEFVTEAPVAIGNASQTDPAVLTFGSLGALTAVPDNGAVVSSYAPGDLITLAGGIFLSQAVLLVTTSLLTAIQINAPGTGYGVGDTVTLGGGTAAPQAVVSVASLQAVAASGFITFAVNPSDGDTITLNGVAWTFKTIAVGATQTTIQPTLAGTMSQLADDLNASVNASLIVATYTGSTNAIAILYDTTGAGGNAYTLAASAGTRSGATLTGGTTTGIATVTVTTPGVFTAIPAGGNMTQTATSSGGTGASFQAAVFGVDTVSIANPGAYTTVPPNGVAQASTTGTGSGIFFTMTWAAIPAFSNGDWLFIEGVQGMTELNGNTYIAAGVTPTTVQLFDLYGQPVDATGFGAYTGGGTASRIYTLATIYNEEDLPYLKFSQSADEMTLTCVNQLTSVEYPPQVLARFSDTNWVFSDAVAAPTVDPPSSAAATITAGGTTFYQYKVTAVSPVDKTESVASPIASVTGVTMSVGVGQVNLSWNPVPEVAQYNIYKAEPSYGSQVPVGALFGLIGSAYGTAFHDTASPPDFTTVPPRHENPFARGQIIGVNIISGGSGYTTATAAITSATGADAELEVAVINGAVVAVVIDDAGHDYQPGDTVTITGTGGTGATAALVIGPQTGTYPSVSGYFQQRRVYAASLNKPDTYDMSQPGAFSDFDTRIPTIDTDAIEGSPWSVQVNGIQFMVQTSAGLLVLTGQSAWLIVGAGSFATNAQPISPDNQAANPQPFTGCSPTVPPVKINFDVLYVIAKGSYYYVLPYQGYSFSEPLDITEYSTHLFTDFDVLEHAWCEQPFKTLWSVRDDGTMLSLTYLKAEQISGWARHDTNGLYCSVTSIAEPPVDALYIATKRFIGNNVAYMIERADDRLWKTVEDVWAVDCGLQLTQTTPNATLTADSVYGPGTITGATGLVGGSGYSAATQATIDDLAANPEMAGSGATASVTVVGGVITAVNILTPGSGYTNPSLTISDPEGQPTTQASARLTLNTTATFLASFAVFQPGDVGSVIRMGGGIAQITAYIDHQTVQAQLRTPIIKVRPNSGGIVEPQAAGKWTLSPEVTIVGGLGHLAGAMVTGLADGNVVTPRLVSATGTVELDVPASAVTLGLGFTAQLQSVYLDGGSPTVQGQRKKIATVSVLVEASRGIELGANQVDGSTLIPAQIAPSWYGMQIQPDQVPAPYNSTTQPLYTGFLSDSVQGGWQKNGQVALQQELPLPMNVLSIQPSFLAGDVAEQDAPKHQRAQQQ